MLCAVLRLAVARLFKTVPKTLKRPPASTAPAGCRPCADLLPLCTRRLHFAGIFAFTLSQNEFLYALIVDAKARRTVPVGVISDLIRGDVFYWGQLMAGALLGSIPVAISTRFCRALCRWVDLGLGQG